MIAKEMKFTGNIIFDNTKPDGQFRKPTDNSKLISYLPDFKFTPMEEGLKETIKWFRSKLEPQDCGWMYTTIDGLKHRISELRKELRKKMK